MAQHYHHHHLTPLSDLDDWQLENADQDIRGFKVYDQPGHVLGEIEEMLVDEESEEVSMLRLTSGQEIPAADVVIGEDGVFLKHMTLTTPMVRVYER